MKIVDLHVHSNCSDGSDTPSKLVDIAIEKGLSVFALTDHDTVAGIDEALDYARGKDIRVLPGIEFSTEYLGKDIHIVGLDIDYKDPTFQSKLQCFVDSRILRNQKMCRNLTEAGIDITYERLVETYPGSVITRAHYSRYLFDHGYVKSMPEAFDRYLGDHTKYFVPREKITPAQAVELVLEAKGIPVLAHPTLYHMGKEQLSILIRLLKDAGLVGIEGFYSTYSTADTREIHQLAERFELLISGGSDYHGAAKPGLEMATGYGKLIVPDSVWEKLESWKESNL